ncbi:unnamed protein product [Arctogadus glacialis]
MGTSAAEGLTSEHSGGFLLSRRSGFRNVLQGIIEQRGSREPLPPSLRPSRAEEEGDGLHERGPVGALCSGIQSHERLRILGLYHWRMMLDACQQHCITLGGRGGKRDFITQEVSPTPYEQAGGTQLAVAQLQSQ